MPTIAEGVAANQAAQNSAGGAPVPAQSLTPVSTPTPQPTNLVLPTRGSFPPDVVLDVDFKTALPLETMWPFRARTLSTREMKAHRPAQISPAVEAAAEEQALAAQHLFFAGPVVGAPAKPTFRRIVASDLPPFATDGLIHGDLVWEIDPAYIMLRDEFTHNSATSTEIGDLGWTGSFGASTPVVSGDAVPYLGILRLPSGAGSNLVNQLSLGLLSTSEAPSTAWPILDNPSWKMIWIFTLTAQKNTGPAAFSMAKKTFYLGFHGPNQALEKRPSTFIGLRFDKDLTAPAINDTTFKFEVVENSPSVTRNNTQGTVFDTGKAPVENRVYRLEIVGLDVGVIQMSLFDGISVVSSGPITVPKFSASANVTPTVANNYVAFAGATPPGPWGTGSVLSVSGANGTNINGTFLLHYIQMSASPTSSLTYRSTGAVAGAAAVTTFAGLPALAPIVIFGNDSEAAPAETVTLGLDFFSFVWNPSGGGPNLFLPRYWPLPGSFTL